MSAQNKKKTMTTATGPTKAMPPVAMIELLEGRRLLSASFAGADATPVEESAAGVTVSDFSFPSRVTKSSPALAVGDADSAAKETPNNPTPPKGPPKIPLTDILVSSY